MDFQKESNFASVVLYLIKDQIQQFSLSTLRNPKKLPLRLMMKEFVMLAGSQRKNKKTIGKSVKRG